MRKIIIDREYDSIKEWSDEYFKYLSKFDITFDIKVFLDAHSSKNNITNREIIFNTIRSVQDTGVIHIDEQEQRGIDGITVLADIDENTYLFSDLGLYIPNEYNTIAILLGDTFVNYKDIPNTNYYNVLSNYINSTKYTKSFSIQNTTDFYIIYYSKVLDKWIELQSIMSIQLSTQEGGGYFVIKLGLDNNLEGDSNNNVKDSIININNSIKITQQVDINDLVFISLESNNQIGGTNLIDKIDEINWDMIGMVDKFEYMQDNDKSSIEISLFGSDLMKLLREDGSYYFPVLFNKSNVVNNKDSGSNLIQRGVLGGFEHLTEYNRYSDIRTSINLIIASLSISKFGYSNDNGDVLGNIDVIDPERRSFTEGIWRLTDVVIDEGVENIIVLNSTLAREQGSIIQTMKKICQFPFIEFYGDTYGNKYSYVVRKPPFDRESIFSYINNTINKKDADDNNLFSKSDKFYIDRKSIISIEDMSFADDTNIYSWYRLTPYSLGQATNGVSGGYVMVVYFNEFANYYGSKSLDMNLNYLSFNNVQDKLTFNNRGEPTDEKTESEDKQIQGYLKSMTIFMKYLIDSYSYLPFTRNCRLVILGDRRIKRGMWIRIENEFSMSEIFYVESVSHNFNIQSTTTTSLILTRGMLEKYMEADGIDVINGSINNTGFTYFDVINTKLPEEGQYKKSIDWGVKRNVFDFFRKKQQFL